MIIENYRLKASNGNHIRWATSVTFDDGYQVRFLDKLSKKEAKKQAFYFREGQKHENYNIDSKK